MRSRSDLERVLEPIGAAESLVDFHARCVSAARAHTRLSPLWNGLPHD
jgi:hypothetical protein